MHASGKRKKVSVVLFQFLKNKKNPTLDGDTHILFHQKCILVLQTDSTGIHWW